MIKGYHPINSLPVKIGDKVVIPKGSTVKSMNPNHPIFVTKKKMTVTIRSLGCGTEMEGSHFQEYHAHQNQNAETYTKEFQTESVTFTRQYRIIQNPTVLWAGTGGYWNEVDINEILK